MNWLTRCFLWVEVRLDNGAWFRRLYVIFATVLSWNVIKWSMHFAETSNLPGVEVAAIIAAVTASVAAIQTFAFTDYMKSRVG